MGQLKLALPDVSPAVLALALQEVSWETDQAEQLLEQFLAVKGGQLAEVQKVHPSSTWDVLESCACAWLVEHSIMCLTGAAARWRSGWRCGKPLCQRVR